MRRRLPVLLVAIALGAVATGSLHAWVAYTAARWPGGATMTLNRSSVANVSASQAAAAIQTAMSAWNNAGAKMALALSGGDTNANQIANDGVSAIFFRPDSNGSAIATTYAWWYNNVIIESDIVFWNGGRVFFAGSSGCSGGYYIEDVAAHELGHVVGLDHSSFVDANGQTATMYPTTGQCDQNFRSLSSDDIGGIRSLYGVGSSGTGGTGASSPPQITSPAPGSTLTGSSQSFTWTAGTGASELWLHLGSTPGGRDLFEKGLTGSSITATGLPTDGRPIYATLWFVQNGAWQYATASYTAAASGSTGTLMLTSPAAGSTLSGSSQTFTWTAGTGATELWLHLGSTPGGRDLFEKGLTGSSITATGLPTDGRTIYATLWFVQNGAWQHANATYTAFR